MAQGEFLSPRLFDEALRHERIEGLLAKLRDYYVFSEKACNKAKLRRGLKQRGASGATPS